MLRGIEYRSGFHTPEKIDNYLALKFDLVRKHPRSVFHSSIGKTVSMVFAVQSGPAGTSNPALNPSPSVGNSASILLSNSDATLWLRFSVQSGKIRTKRKAAMYKILSVFFIASSTFSELEIHKRTVTGIEDKHQIHYK